ncbi:polysaccharide deacetylase family protein [Sphingobium cloacae]|uniref:Polysaccharide deacetylase n=1 Tax=Sphingobium cloacae TaxID=120107 RepID=A0A1E1F520_9SPHN|nr:hypothetical protein [Sphingobium cloacae]BAV65620.1 hypothetical protein SCLO_1025800 [Sphingobium cloacae]
MTTLLITVDTELSAALYQRGLGLEENLRRSIWGEAEGRAYGIEWQMTLMERHGLKGVFFLDPLPALLYGADFLKPIVDAVVGRGHEIQLHVHSEWLQWAKSSPVGGRQGRNIGDFSLADQIVLLGCGKRLLEEAGAPAVTAFRAGNFGANDDTLRALAKVGIAWDSSVNPAYLGRDCAISASGLAGPHRMLGLTEVPVSGIADRPGGFRPAQICAMSAAEMRVGLRHAVQERQAAFVVVTHSFEMLSRDRARPNRAVMRRFERLCEEARRLPGVEAGGFADLSPSLGDGKPGFTLAPPSRARTASRMAQQLWAHWRYERKLAPA